MVFGLNAPLGEVVKLCQSNKVLSTQDCKRKEYHLFLMDQLFESQLSGISSNQPTGNCVKRQRKGCLLLMAKCQRGQRACRIMSVQ